MPWYKFSARHGGGHQSHNEAFRFFDHKMSEGELRSEWEYLFREYDNCLGDAKVVRRLPAAEINRQKLHHIWAIEGAVKELRERFGIVVKVRFPQGFVAGATQERERRLTRERECYRRRSERITREARKRWAQKEKEATCPKSK